MLTRQTRKSEGKRGIGLISAQFDLEKDSTNVVSKVRRLLGEGSGEVGAEDVQCVVQRLNRFNELFPALRGRVELSDSMEEACDKMGVPRQEETWREGGLHQRGIYQGDVLESRVVFGGRLRMNWCGR